MLLALSMEPHAAPIGLPESTARIGVGGGVSRLAVDDPAGPTESKLAVQPITLIFTDWFAGASRYWMEFYYSQADLAAGTHQVGQNVQHYGYRASLQMNVPLLAVGTWIGAGFDVSRAHYELRHTVDQDGFLANRYDDRESVQLGVVLNIATEWQIADNWSMGAKAEQLFPINGDVDELTGLVSLLYRY